MDVYIWTHVHLDIEVVFGVFMFRLVSFRFARQFLHKFFVGGDNTSFSQCCAESCSGNGTNEHCERERGNRLNSGVEKNSYQKRPWRATTNTT